MNRTKHKLTPKPFESKTPKETLYKAVFALWLKGYTPLEIANANGMTRQRMYQIITPQIQKDHEYQHLTNRAKLLR